MVVRPMDEGDPIDFARVMRKHEHHGPGCGTRMDNHQVRDGHCQAYRVAAAAARLEGVVAIVAEAVGRHPEPCTDTPFTCGWKSAVIDVRGALQRTGEAAA